MIASPNPGNKIVDLEMPTLFDHAELSLLCAQKLGISQSDLRVEILKQSLDARSAHNPHWKLRIAVWSPAFSTQQHTNFPNLQFSNCGKKKKVVVIGSGPAGYFCSLALAKSGFSVTLLEQGPQVKQRWQDVQNFDAGGAFQEKSNYVFGEGGAGTFSDGKLTSRTKGIDAERNFVFQTYISAGAPPEINYLAHPHIGSDKLREITPRLRELLESEGICIEFETTVLGIVKQGNRVLSVVSNKGTLDAHFFVFACGHSASQTTRMLMQNGVMYLPKPFAVGMRFEIPQLTANLAMWKRAKLPGVKAAEFFFTSQTELPVYSFCMCPGGKVIPAMTTSNTLLVNGVSNYQRDGEFANAAIVAGVDLRQLISGSITAAQCLDWRENIERRAHESVRSTHAFAAPAARVDDFMAGKSSASLPPSSYPFPLVAHSYENIFDQKIIDSIRFGLKDLTKKMRGFEEGILIGVETTTSSPIRVARTPSRVCEGFENLFVAGEMSGWSGGIVSSAVDGVKTALSICSL